MLSSRTKEATKTALAMTIVYAVALSMDWPNPHWAGFAVAVMSLSTVGQSLNKGLGRVFGLAIFVLVAGISNQQSYSFLAVANTALMFPLVFGLLALNANIPFSARSEKVFLRLHGGFFHSCNYLLSTMGWGLTTTPTRLDRWRKAFHAQQVAALPQKLATWGKAVDTGVLPGTAPRQVQALTTHLQSLAYRMQELMDAQTSSHAKLLVRELLVDVRAWRPKSAVSRRLHFQALMRMKMAVRPCTARAPRIFQGAR